MKAKYVVSLSVALVFFVLSATGLLIYFGQGTHAIEHTHAWFGILFVGAAVFHILNNWSPLRSYANERKTGRIRPEFILVAVLTLVFVVGVSADVPGFAALANAGKKLVGRGKPQPAAVSATNRPADQWSQQAVDSVARGWAARFNKACNTTDTALLSSVVSPGALLWNGAGQVATIPGKRTTESVAYRVDVAKLIADELILVHGSRSSRGTTDRLFTYVLKKEAANWRAIAGQSAPAR